MYRLIMTIVLMFISVAQTHAAGGYSYPGTILASQTTELAFRVGGPLIHVNIDAGTQVKKGSC